jgi:hypothetical protein
MQAASVENGTDATHAAGVRLGHSGAAWELSFEIAHPHARMVRLRLLDS